MLKHRHHSNQKRKKLSLGYMHALICSIITLSYSRKYWWGINLGGLAFLEANRQIKFCQYNIQSINCFIHVCEDKSNTYHMLRYFNRSHPSVCPVSSAPLLLQKQRACCDLSRYVTDRDGIRNHCNSVHIRVLRFPLANECFSNGWQKCLEMWSPLTQRSIGTSPWFARTHAWF